MLTIPFLPKHFAEVNSNPITFPESEDDMPTTALPETMSINVTPALIKTQPDQKLIFTNDPDQFPKFEIKFLGASPASPGDELTGKNQVVINVAPTAIGTFHYMIIHTQPSGATPSDNLHIGVFSIRSCAGGCP